MFAKPIDFQIIHFLFVFLFSCYLFGVKEMVVYHIPIKNHSTILLQYNIYKKGDQHSYRLFYKKCIRHTVL